MFTIPELRLLVGELAEMVERTGVVDEDVDRAVLVDDTLHRIIDLRAIADVAHDRRVRLLHVEHDDRRARTLERQRVGPAEPARTSRDDCDPTREVDLNHAALRRRLRRRHQDARHRRASV
jgi:hypothetical protein